jgi:hypothetical protein
LGNRIMRTGKLDKSISKAGTPSPTNNPQMSLEHKLEYRCVECRSIHMYIDPFLKMI